MQYCLFSNVRWLNGMKHNENTVELVLCGAIKKDFVLEKSWMSTASLKHVAVDEWSPLFTDTTLPLYITEANEWQRQKAATLSWVNKDILSERIFQGPGFLSELVKWDKTACFFSWYSQINVCRNLFWLCLHCGHLDILSVMESV